MGTAEIRIDRITPHLWYDKEAIEAAELYAQTFKNSRVTSVNTIRDTPSGDTDIVNFELFSESFSAISAGPLFKFTPAISFLVACETNDEVDQYWAVLSKDGTALMPLASYPFSERYGWTEDRFGVSWQVMKLEEPIEQRITPTLMFVGDVLGRAEEAIEHYTSVFPDSKVGEILRWSEGEEPEQEGLIKHGEFQLSGHHFAAMDSALQHNFSFNESISFIVNCDDQDEVDYYWNRLSAVPESEQCGWLKDKFGVSWQIVPTAMGRMMNAGSHEQISRVTECFLKMKKFDIAELERAYTGS